MKARPLRFLRSAMATLIFSPATKSVCLFENESVCLERRVEAYDCIPARREGGKGWKRKGQWKETGEELKDRRLFKKWERRNKKSWCEKRRNVKKKDRKERWWKMGREKGSAQSLWEIFGSARAGQMDSSSHDALQPNRESYTFDLSFNKAFISESLLPLNLK